MSRKIALPERGVPVLSRSALFAMRLEVRSLPPQPNSPCAQPNPAGRPEGAGNSGLSRICLRSPPSHLAVLAGQTAKSLGLAFQIFPLSGNCGQRLGSIATGREGRKSDLQPLSSACRFRLTSCELRPCDCAVAVRGGVSYCNRPSGNRPLAL
jgi:hypothetical protein